MAWKVLFVCAFGTCIVTVSEFHASNAVYTVPKYFGTSSRDVPHPESLPKDGLREGASLFPGFFHDVDGSVLSCLASSLL
ncbi:hypothetical protein BJ508DRAFT_136045 [Ascobolus immersus RN42]|uniref:Uncharacterized protein n=1 Tax=Ascobolus immersus RN42 TaxID=1160509 RepID=A0A3N4IKD3_ASCIM|nr:hypothetical protein BJ508DRAFT_136045 [Ascobolus immersus RN42]